MGMEKHLENSVFTSATAGYLIGIALLVSLVASHPVLAASPIGTTVNASTTVSAGGRTLQKSSPLFFNDVVKTNATGLGEFVFNDGTKLAMGPSASVVIDKFIYKGQRTVGQTSIQASKGAFRYISGAFAGHKVATPYGTIGIRGTAFDFTIRNGKVYILLFRGAVSFCNGGSCQTLKRSCDYLVGGGGRVSKPQPLSSGIDSGLNVGQVFPLIVNQRRLTSRFRQGSCFSRAARRSLDAISPKVQAAASPPGQPPGQPPAQPPSGPPAQSGKSNKGFGNGEENNNTPEANNPGKGKGGPHSP
jgi:hypothetical protein